MIALKTHDIDTKYDCSWNPSRAPKLMIALKTHDIDTKYDCSWNPSRSPHINDCPKNQSRQLTMIVLRTHLQPQNEMK